MSRLHGLIAMETRSLGDSLSNQHRRLGDLLNHISDALGPVYENTDQLMLGFYSQPLSARAKTADEELLPDPAARLQGLAANLGLFIMRLAEWREHVAKASETPVSPEEAKEGAEAARSLIERLRDSKALFDEKLAILADDLYLGMAEGMFHGSATPYGFYRSLMNIIVITAQAATGMIPREFIDDETDELKKALRKKARKFIYEETGTLLRLTNAVPIWKPLEAVILYIRNLFG